MVSFEEQRQRIQQLRQSQERERQRLSSERAKLSTQGVLRKLDLQSKGKREKSLSGISQAESIIAANLEGLSEAEREISAVESAQARTAKIRNAIESALRTGRANLRDFTREERELITATIKEAEDAGERSGSFLSSSGLTFDRLTGGLREFKQGELNFLQGLGAVALAERQGISEVSPRGDVFLRSGEILNIPKRTITSQELMSRVPSAFGGDQLLFSDAVNLSRDIQARGMTPATFIKTDTPRQKFEFFIRDEKTGKIKDFDVVAPIAKSLDFIEQRISRPIAKKLNRENNILFRPLFETEEVAKSFLFAPAFSSGTASRYEAVLDDLGRVVGFKKKRELFDTLFDELSESKFATTAGKEADIRLTTRELIKQAKNNPKQLKSLKEFYERAGRGDIFADLFEQEVAELARTRASIPKVTKQSIIRDSPSSSIFGSSVFFGTGRYERTESEIPRTPEGLRNNQITPLGNNLLFPQPQDVKTRQISALVLGLQSGQVQGQPQLQQEKQIQQQQAKQEQGARQQNKLSEGLAQSLGLRLRLRQQQAQKLKQQPRTPRPRPKPRTKGGIPLLETTPQKSALFSGISKLKARGFNVIVGQGRKEKVVFKDLPKYLALKEGMRYIASDISASFKLQATKKPAKKRDIAPFNPYSSGQFRPAKKDASRIVERRKYRLDTASEIMGIKRGKRNKRSKFI